MYTGIITFKPDTPKEILCILHEIAQKAFENKKVRLISTSENSLQCIFEGEEYFNNWIQQLEIFEIYETEGYEDYISSWQYTKS